MDGSQEKQLVKLKLKFRKWNSILLSCCLSLLILFAVISSSSSVSRTILPFAYSEGLDENDFPFQAESNDGSDSRNEGQEPSPDDIPPTVKILYPASCANDITTSGTIEVHGIAFDSETGIKSVEVFSHTYPFNDSFPFKMAKPESVNNWTAWSIPIDIHETKTRILVRATDNADNENWDEVTIDIEEAKEKSEARNLQNALAFVEPSFTNAAYNLDGFYEFYSKYSAVPFGEDITTDLNLMIADIPSDADRAHFMPLIGRVKAFTPESSVTIIGDQDIHDGVIFKRDGSNAYKALFMLHNEYVTQQEYENLKRFVSNGGMIVFVDGNVFYAEVRYDREYCTATLVKGHDWEFDGKAVTKSVSERYLEENREWMGSNYMKNAIWDPVSFSNNPFNYTHFEENYVTNPNVKILHDYGSTIGDNYESDSWHRNATIATYELSFGNGKVIALGVYGQNVSDNPAFLDFFEKTVLMHALAPAYQINAGGDELPIYWKMKSGSIQEITISEESNKIVVDLSRSALESDTLTISLPKAIIDAKVEELEEDSVPGQDQGLHTTAGETAKSVASDKSNTDDQEEKLLVKLNGDEDSNLYEVQVNQMLIDSERIVEIPLASGTTKVEIYGTHVAPEFGTSIIYFAIAAILFVAIASGKLILKGRLFP